MSSYRYRLRWATEALCRGMTFVTDVSEDHSAFVVAVLELLDPEDDV